MRVLPAVDNDGGDGGDDDADKDDNGSDDDAHDDDDNDDDEDDDDDDDHDDGDAYISSHAKINIYSHAAKQRSTSNTVLTSFSMHSLKQ